jgi:hypothetical protein
MELERITDNILAWWADIISDFSKINPISSISWKVNNVLSPI